MNQNNVWQEYLKAVPELQAPFEAQCRENWVDGTDGPYVIWGMGLMPCILERLAYEEQNKDLLDRTFAFFEKMACASEEVRELLLYAVLEKLGDDKACLLYTSRGAAKPRGRKPATACAGFACKTELKTRRRGVAKPRKRSACERPARLCAAKRRRKRRRRPARLCRGCASSTPAQT